MADTSYVDSVRAAAARARTGVGETLFNRSPEHAKVLITELIQSAESELLILTGCLSSAVYDDPSVINAVSGFVTKSGTNVKIIADGKIDGKVNDEAFLKSKLAESKFLTIIRNNRPNVDVVFKLAEDAASIVNCHFLLVDKIGYRFEPNWATTEAFANFYEKSNSAKLDNTFTQLLVKSNPIKL